MATWQKSDPALIERFLASLPLTQGVERRQMFGYPCAFVNGNMFAGLHEQRLIVRLPAEAAARPFKVQGKVMRDYAAIEDALDCPTPQLRAWIAQALDFTRGLPPKAPRARKSPVTPAAKKSAAPARRKP